MPSTYSTNLALELIGTGDQAGVWGNTTNTNLGTLIEQAISGYVTQAVVTGTDTTITIPNGATGVARNMYIELTGTGGTNTNLIVPSNKKLYFIFNNSTGAVTVKVSGQTGVSVPQGKKVVLVSNGTDVVNGLNYIADFGTNSFTVTNLTATSATITTLTGTSAGITTISSGSANITQLQSTSATITTLTGTSANIATLSGTTATFTSATVTNLALTSVTLSNLNIASANITTLTSSSATISTTLALSGGTANGVLYLNASKVATSGSGLSFDGTLLSVGGATNGSRFAVKGSGAFGGFDTGAAADGRIEYAYNGSNIFYTGIDSSSLMTLMARSGVSLAFGANAAEQMRLTSTGLGIGTSSPSFLLHASTSSAAGTVTSGVRNTAADGNTRFALGNNAGAARATISLNNNSDEKLTIGPEGSFPMLFQTNGTERMRLDSSGNLGLGVTPSAWTRKAIQIGDAASGYVVSNVRTGLGANVFFDGSNKYIESRYAILYSQDADAGVHAWYTAPSGTAGNAISFTQAMTLTAGGELLVGTTSAGWAAAGRKTIEVNGSSSALIGLKIADNLNGYMFHDGTDMTVGNNANGYLRFVTNSTERARITSGGYSKFSNAGTYQGSTGSYHELRQSADETIAFVTNTANSLDGTVRGIRVLYNNATPNNTSNNFLYCDDSTQLRASIRSNGGLANYQSNNVDLSDARTKKDIAPAASMWGKIGALEIVTYKYNDQTHDDVNVGVIAQQVESVEPVWVDADGFGETPEGEEPLKTVYTKDITFAAIKALQEAMARIEKLEAEMAALKGA